MCISGRGCPALGVAADAPGVKAFTVDFFGGTSALRIAQIKNGQKIVGHLYIDTKPAAKRLVGAWFPDRIDQGDIRELSKDPEAWAKDAWDRIRASGASEVWCGAGFPCRELTGAGKRRGLYAGETARFRIASCCAQPS